MGRKNGRVFSLVIAVIITAVLFVYRNIEKVGETEVKLFLPKGQEDVLYVVSDQEQAVTWSVKPEDILVLTENDDGSCTVRAVKDGSATVTAKTLDGTEIAQRRVEVASFIDNNDFIWAVENGIDSEFKPVTVNWKKEKDGRVKLTPENLAVIQDVTSLDISGQDLTDLSGIEWFTGLEYLDCRKNNLKKLDVSNLQLLTDLICYDNKLKSLNVSGCSSLMYLDCSSNSLKGLNVTENQDLVTLYCDENSLLELDLSGNLFLTKLYCSDNDLTELDLSRNVELMDLNINGNHFSTLDVSGLPELNYLGCSGNNLHSLDVSENKSLRYLECNDNRITDLDLSSNKLLLALDCRENMLESLDVSGLTELETLYCGKNRMRELDLRNNNLLTDLECGNQTSNGKLEQNLKLVLTPERYAAWTTDGYEDNVNITLTTE